VEDLLNFNPSRKLEFDMGRPLEFDPRRPLEFNPARGLEFQPNRDLGFGRRGVVFRGYVCPICGSLVTPDAKRCTECGAVFESTPRAASPPSGGAVTPPPQPAKSPKQTPPAAKAKAPASMVYCAFCGVRLGKAEEFCWNCGARTSGATEAVKLPTKPTKPATRDWQRGR
jgi:hypothetical protein